MAIALLLLFLQAPAPLFEHAIRVVDERLEVTEEDWDAVVRLIEALPDASPIERVEFGWFGELPRMPGALVIEQAIPGPYRFVGERRVWQLHHWKWAEEFQGRTLPARMQRGWRLRPGLPTRWSELSLDGLGGLPEVGDLQVDSPEPLPLEDQRAIVALAHEIADLPVVRLRGSWRLRAGRKGFCVIAEAPDHWPAETERIRRWLELWRFEDGHDSPGMLRCGAWAASRDGLQERREIVFEEDAKAYVIEAPGLSAEEARQLVLSFISQPFHFAEGACARTRASIRGFWSTEPVINRIQRTGELVEFQSGLSTCTARHSPRGWTIVAYRYRSLCMGWEWWAGVD